MNLYPAVIVHGMEDVRLAMRPQRPVLLLSAPGAALFAGCGFWLALVGRAEVEFPGGTMQNALDCADASGAALAAIRIGVHGLVLRPDAPGFAAVAAIAAERGLCLMTTPPSSLDLSVRGSARHLESWLARPSRDIDRATRLR